MQPALSSLSSGLSNLASRLGLDVQAMRPPAAGANAELIAAARSSDAATSGNALRQIDGITGSRMETDALVKGGGKPGRNEDDNSNPQVPDPPGGGRPPAAGSGSVPVGSSGQVDPGQWGRACAIGGGIVGAGIGGTVGATGGGALGAGGGTLVAPGVGTIGGGAAGAWQGGALGAAAGGSAGALIGGGLCQGAGMIFNAIQGGGSTGGSDNDARIDTAANSSNPGTKLEGEAAQGLRGEGIKIEGFNTPVGPNGNIGEIDIETGRTIVEVTVKSGGKLSQINKYLTNPSLNPDSKSVILYAPNYGGRATQDVVNAGGHVAKTPQELVDLVRRLGG